MLKKLNTACNSLALVIDQRECWSCLISMTRHRWIFKQTAHYCNITGVWSSILSNSSTPLSITRAKLLPCRVNFFNIRSHHLLWHCSYNVLLLLWILSSSWQRFVPFWRKHRFPYACPSVEGWYGAGIQKGNLISAGVPQSLWFDWMGRWSLLVVYIISNELCDFGIFGMSALVSWKSVYRFSQKRAGISGINFFELAAPWRRYGFLPLIISLMAFSGRPMRLASPFEIYARRNLLQEIFTGRNRLHQISAGLVTMVILPTSKIFTLSSLIFSTISGNLPVESYCILSGAASF